MAAESQSYEPEKLTAGMTWKWNKTISDYPATEWTLTYYLRINGPTAPEKIVALTGLFHVWFYYENKHLHHLKHSNCPQKKNIHQRASEEVLIPACT